MIDHMIQNTNQYDILIVDDTPESLELLNRMLQERGYRVRPATNGRHALKSVTAKLPDLILLDIKMPEMDGYEVCRHLKSNAHSRNIPVIFISAHDETAKKVEGFKAGGVDYITKPFEREEVLARVEIQLRLHELTEHLEQQVDQRTRQLQQEILEREQAQEQLRESEKRYSKIVEGTDNLITEVDAEGRFIFVNETARKVLGLPPHECIGRLAFDFTHPDDREITRKSFLQWVKDKKSSVTFENRQMSRSGKVTDMHWTINLHFDYKGNITSVKSIARDVTEQKKAQAALSWEAEINLAAAELSRKLLSPASIDDLSSLVLEQAKRLTCSAFGFVGYIAPETGYLICPTLTRDIWETCQVADKDIVFKKFTGLWGWVLENQRPLMTNAAVDDHRSSGTPPGHIPIHRFLSSPALIGETFVGQVAVANSDNNYTDRDLQVIERLANLYAIAIQRQRAEQELERHRDRLEEMVKERTAELSDAKEQAEAANQFKSDFLARMSHEIRTPLNAVTGLTNIVLKSDMSNEQRDYLNKVQLASYNLMGVINDILDFSKVEAGRLDLAHDPFDLDQVMEHLADLFSERVAEKDLKMRIEVAPQVPRQLCGDAGRLTQVLTNLIGNAIKFTDQGEIVVGVDSDDKDPKDHTQAILKFRVSDTGVGINADLLPTLFDPFTQVDDSLTRRHKGTGLGLAICRQLVNLMRGRIWAESTPGKGSTFSFSVMLEEARRELSEAIVLRHAQEPVALPIQHLAGQRVLVVEDSALNREVAVALLEETGLLVETAENGKIAVEAVEAITGAPRSYYNAIFMDIQMPLMDGYEATRKIREIERRKNTTTGQAEFKTPIIALTAHALKGEEEKCIGAGMDDYLSKPIDEQELHRMLLKYISSR